MINGLWEKLKLRFQRFSEEHEINIVAVGWPADSVHILEAIKMKDCRVCLNVAMKQDFYDELYMFLKQKGYISLKREKEGIELILEFGLSKEKRNNLEKIRDEMRDSSYAAVKYKCYKYYKENQAITIGLNIHLQNNKLLKKKLMEHGMDDYVSEDDWDDWSEKTIDGLYRRYVFGK